MPVSLIYSRSYWSQQTIRIKLTLYIHIDH
uniref:Uncharacterized protein n=1 Tax=Anguilla anguilla TaxID=7936 RepID=A0A0E9W7M8_ANGAN